MTSKMTKAEALALIAKDEERRAKQKLYHKKYNEEHKEEQAAYHKQYNARRKLLLAEAAELLAGLIDEDIDELSK